MKRLLLALLPLILFFARTEAQQMNFQGKIFYAGLPFSGSATMTFVLPDFLWTDNESVTVNNGLYSCVVGATNPMPIKLFDSAHHSRQMIVMFNTNPVDTITLFAPFERDPSVPGYIRDSITWANVHNKPTIDTSFTNEIQYLTLHGDTLRIDSTGQGNWVIIPGFGDTSGTRVVNGNFTVIDSALTNMLSLTPGGSYSIFPPNMSVWQSFKATANGKLRDVKLNMASTISTISVNIYNGQGPGTPAIYSFIPISGVSSAPGWITIPLSSYAIPLASGNTYTIMIIPATGGQITAQLQNNPYPDGIAGTDLLSTSAITNFPDSDWTFSVDIDNTNPACLTFGNNCYVGIGTNNPTSQLEVKGRIKDQTGLVMPVGTIIAFGGRNIPVGWLQCDGRAVSRVDYSDLFDVVDTSWGHGDGSTTFNLPDLRGRFARGVDSSTLIGSSGNDPDHSSRLPGGGSYGGNSGNRVGSLQSDQIASHSHPYGHPSCITSNVGAGGGACVWYGDYTTSTSSTGGNETRPKNVNVYYIIKY